MMVQDFVITHNDGTPYLQFVKIKQYGLRELIGFAGKVDIMGDVNEPILQDFFDDHDSPSRF